MADKIQNTEITHQLEKERKGLHWKQEKENLQKETEAPELKL